MMMHEVERPPSDQRFVLCRPRGGLNDTLCQIEKCWRYAENHSRALVIDTRNSGLLGEFEEFFVPKDADGVYTRLTDSHLAELNQLDCIPGSVRGRLGVYTAVYDSQKKYVDVDTSTRLTFDFDRNWSEPVLVHEQCGGGQLSFDLLRRVSLSPEAREYVLSATRHLGQGYAAIHIRNTDYQTNYEGLFRSIASSLSGRSILICSDDPEVIIRARSMFKSSELLTVSALQASGGKPLHRHSSHGSDEQRRAATLGSIADLVALGAASDLYFTDVTKGYPSGFSRLAEYLCRNPDVLAALMQVPRKTEVGVSVQGRTHYWRPPGERLKDRMHSLRQDIKKHAMALVQGNRTGK